MSSILPIWFRADKLSSLSSEMIFVLAVTNSLVPSSDWPNRGLGVTKIVVREGRASSLHSCSRDSRESVGSVHPSGEYRWMDGAGDDSKPSPGDESNRYSEPSFTLSTQHKLGCKCFSRIKQICCNFYFYLTNYF